MIPDINIFTPEVLATLANVNGDIVATSATCTLLSDSDNADSCCGCPFNYTLIGGCIDKHYQVLLAEHFPELFVHG